MIRRYNDLIGKWEIIGSANASSIKLDNPDLNPQPVTVSEQFSALSKTIDDVKGNISWLYKNSTSPGIIDTIKPQIIDETWYIGDINTGVPATGLSPIFEIGEITEGPQAGGDLVYKGVEPDTGKPIYSLVLVLPRGSDGKDPLFEIGDVTTVDPGGDAGAAIVPAGTDPSTGKPIFKLDLSLPKGDEGKGIGVVVQETEPVDDDVLWLDTSEPSVGSVTNADLQPVFDAIQGINAYLDTIVRQRDLIINPGHFDNNVTNTTARIATPIDPNTGLTSVSLSPMTAEEIEPDPTGYEPNTKAVRAHYGTQKELQDNFKKFVDYELLLTTDTKRLYTKIEGEPVNLTGSGGSSGGGIDYDALDRLDTIGLIAPDGQIWRVKVNSNGSLVVYKKELDTDQTEPTGGQTDPSGWVYVTTLFLQKLYINSLYCGGFSSDKYSYNPCSHNFVELSNLTDKDISLKGLSLQYGTEGSDWEVLDLWGTIKAGSTFLIRGAQCSVIDINTTRIKVPEPDMEWIDSSGSLIKFDNTKSKFFLTWGTTASSVSNPFSAATNPIRVSKGYIDLVGLQIPNAGDSDKVDAFEVAPYSFLNSRYLFTKYYTMDGVSQATKALSARNNTNDMYRVNLEADIIPRIDTYTPKASISGKNIFFNKTLLDPTHPNKVTMTLGLNGTAPNASRCFNWVSVGYYDEFLWYRLRGTSVWSKVESFKDETGYRKYYNRIRALTTDGVAFTTHKVVIQGLGAGEYEYYVGRGDSYKSDEIGFTVYDGNAIKDNWTYIQTSDQQGFNWDEYQVWMHSSKYIKDHEIAGKTVGFMINTGDMTQNGNRINEWLDYEEGRKPLRDLAEMPTIGNNDLTPADVYVLGNGGDSSKINATNMRFFYTFEMDPANPPVFTIAGKEIFVESLYSFNFAGTHFLCVNSEVSSNTEKSVWGIPEKTIYARIKEWVTLDRTRNANAEWYIAYCHEMPFTIITQNLINSFYWAGTEDPKIERSGSRINFNTEDVDKYWFSKFCQENGYKLVMGGHKHTYTVSFPLLENDGESMKPIIQVTPAILQSAYGSTEMYTETTGTLAGNSYPVSWRNNPIYDAHKHLCKFQVVTSVNAPTYVMCQATGYKHTSNKELPSPNTPWLRYFFPATVTSASQSDVTAKVNAGQRYPFYVVYTIGATEIRGKAIKLDKIFNSSGKFDINVQGVSANPVPLGGNGETNNGNDPIIIN